MCLNKRLTVNRIFAKADQKWLWGEGGRETLKICSTTDKFSRMLSKKLKSTFSGEKRVLKHQSLGG